MEKHELIKNVGIVVFSAALIFSCADNAEKTLNQINSYVQQPLGIVQGIKMVYTDSAKVRAVLTSPIHVDYTNLSFKYSEFPKGLKVVFFDYEGNENEVIADYGIFYDATKIVDLRGNVQLTSHNGSTLTTSQLFWDADSDWIFTEQPFTFKDQNYNFDAIRLDTNKEFTRFNTGKLVGTVTVSEAKDSLL